MEEAGREEQVACKSMGIPMGQPLFMAKKEFSKAIYINANHYNYAEISNQVMSVLKEFLKAS